MRVSNFLLWQLAYTEFYCTDVLWPDFNRYEFLRALLAYQSLEGGRAADAHETPGHSDSAGGGGGVVRDLLQLAVNLERMQDPVPVTDSTTRPVRGDRKVRSQERAMRIALGHRPDDHEDEPTWQQQQY